MPKLRPVLPGWEIQVASVDDRRPWRDEALRVDRHENNLWCRHGPGQPWLLDITIGEGDDDAWVYRRDLRVRVPWPDAVLRSAEDIPYLAPELQLLFKGVNPRAKDDHDAREVIPVLDEARRVRLANLLPADHPWRQLFPVCP